MKWRAGLWVLFLVISWGLAGCGKKETPPPVIEETTALEVLPELEQNKMHLNNPIVPALDDTFEPVANEMEESSVDALETQRGALVD